LNIFKQKELEGLESDIEAMEQSILSIDEEMVKCSEDYEKLLSLQSEKDEKQINLDEMMAKWMTYQ